MNAEEKYTRYFESALIALAQNWGPQNNTEDFVAYAHKIARIAFAQDPYCEARADYPPKAVK